MTTPVSNFPESQSTLPPSNAATPTLDTTFTKFSRGVYVGASEDLSVVMAGNGATVVSKDIAAGVMHPMIISRINSASTATDLVVAG